jgi:hypothetical protein
MFRKHFTNKGLVDAKVGYIGGQSEVSAAPEHHTALALLSELL